MVLKGGLTKINRVLKFLERSFEFELFNVCKIYIHSIIQIKYTLEEEIFFFYLKYITILVGLLVVCFSKLFTKSMFFSLDIYIVIV